MIRALARTLYPLVGLERYAWFRRAYGGVWERWTPHPHWTPRWFPAVLPGVRRDGVSQGGCAAPP